MTKEEIVENLRGESIFITEFVDSDITMETLCIANEFIVDEPDRLLSTLVEEDLISDGDLENGLVDDIGDIVHLVNDELRSGSDFSDYGLSYIDWHKA